MQNRFLSFRFILISFCLISLWSCGDRPSYVLSEDKMVDLMADMEIAEAYVNTGHSASSKERIEIGQRVLKAHGVSEETLDTTLAWYGRNMDEYSKLFEKVDKEILKRQEKFTETPDANIKEANSLWPYSEHLLISNLSGRDALTFSLNRPDVNKGDIIQLSFFLPNSVALKGTLGVEYNDGYGEAMVTNISSNKKVEIKLHTDTSKIVSRIFGDMHLKDIKNLPVFIDSIKIVAEPYDSVNYRQQRRSQKTFAPFVIKIPEKVDTVDSLKSLGSTIFKNDSILPKDSINHPSHITESIPDKMPPKGNIPATKLNVNSSKSTDKAKFDKMKKIN